MSELGDNWECNPENLKTCPACDGAGIVDDEPCPECGQSGEVTPIEYKLILSQ